LPVISHCSPNTPVYFRGKPEDLKSLISNSRITILTEGKTKKQLCSYFAHPSNYEFVFNEVGDVKIDLAHYGSDYFWDDYLRNPKDPGNWFLIINQMMLKYPTLYTDVSYTFNEKEHFPLLKKLLSDPIIQNKVLFGSDYYMVETKTDEGTFEHNLRQFLGDQVFSAIAFNNPVKFMT
jgi:predicted TIM-barrel fold metal-dependent hydrolase